MLCKEKIISIFCLIDDILHGIEHKEDIRRQVSARENDRQIASGSLYLWR